MSEEEAIQELKEWIAEGEFEAAFDLCRDVREASEGAIDERFYFGAAYSLFSLGHIKQSEKWVQFYGEVTSFGVGYLFLDAYLELHKGHPERSLTHWTRILELEPANTFADPLIEELRSSEEGLLHRSRNPDLVHHFIPLDLLEYEAKDRQRRLSAGTAWKKRLAGPFSRRLVLGLLGVLLASGLLYFVGRAIGISSNTWLGSYLRPSQLEEGLPRPPQSGSVTPQGFYREDRPRFVYASKKEALADFAKARKRIVAGQPNRARYLLGKIELSNASFEIKERALQLRDAIPRSSMSSFSDPVSLSQIQAEPWIYRGAELLLTGRIQGRPLRQEQILRFFLRLPDTPDTECLILYDYGAGSAREDIPGLAEGLKLRVFGEFTEKKENRLIIHAREIQIVRSD